MSFVSVLLSLSIVIVYLFRVYGYLQLIHDEIFTCGVFLLSTRDGDDGVGDPWPVLYEAQDDADDQADRWHEEDHLGGASRGDGPRGVELRGDGGRE